MALQIKLVLMVSDAAAVAKASAALPALRATSLATAVEFARLYASPMMPVDGWTAGRGHDQRAAPAGSGDCPRAGGVEVAARSV